jgi:hypothetical protein
MAGIWGCRGVGASPGRHGRSRDSKSGCPAAQPGRTAAGGRWPTRWTAPARSPRRSRCGCRLRPGGTRPRVTQQARQAALVAGGGELPIRRPPVAFQDPRIPLAEHHRGVLEATAGGDAVDDHDLAGERSQLRPGPATRSRRGPRPGWRGRRPPAPGRSARPRRAARCSTCTTRRADPQAELAEQTGELGGRQAQCPGGLVVSGSQRCW